MKNLKDTFLPEIPQFREIGHKFKNKEISVGDFKGISGGMGVYAQRGGEEFMIRLRIPSGIMNLEQLKAVYELSKKRNLDNIHLTTRQAIQLHDLSIDEVCDIMEEALDKGIYTRGGGGNFPRNVSISPLSGVDKEEEFDVTNYAMEVNKYFMNRITTYKLPRKLKVSFSSGNSDTGNATINDLGFLACKKDNKDFFKLYLAGGLGKNPSLSVEYDELIEGKDILYCVEAMVNLFIAEGNYENKNKARTRYIVDRMGKEDFIACYKKHLNEVKAKENLDVNIDPKKYNKKGLVTDIKHNRLIPQKQEGLYSVFFHPINGQLTLENLKLIIDSLKNIDDVEIRLDMHEGMYIRNLNGEEAKEILSITQNLGAENCLQQSVACIGVPTCQIGIGESQKLLKNIVEYFEDKNYSKDILPIIHISGCPNSCGTHQIAKLGFVGKKKRVNDVVSDVYELYYGGNVGNNDTKLGKSYGDILCEKVPEFLYELSKDIENSELEFVEYTKNNSNRFEDIVNKYIV